MFTDQQKLACVERELAIRRGVYAARVKNGLMSDAARRYEIAVMEEIAADYRAKVQPVLALGESP